MSPLWDLQKTYADRVKAMLHDRLGRAPRACVRTFGCQQNEADSQRIEGMLSQMGYSFTGNPEEADLIIFNTCAVRENAEDRVFGNVGELKRQKEKNPELIIGLCGCMVQQPHITKRIQKSFPYVDLVFGTHALASLPELLFQKLQSRRRVFDIHESDGEIVEGLPVRRVDGVKAWVPIMYGCNNFCTYCIVPYVRGRERSREPEAILEEIKQLTANGVKEITLLGQNVNSYGKNLERPLSFAGLLEQIDALPGDFRIRFMTSHPKDCTRELIDAIARCQKVCRHIHLPVQSGSSRVLSAMNRHYTREQYVDLIRYAREKIPGVSFTSDILVGFPGETYEEFLETLSLVQEIEYDSLFTFIYSKREGTRAAQMEDPVPYAEKSAWLRQIIAAQEDIASRRHEALVGETLRVLVEGAGKHPGTVQGRSDQNIIVEFPGEESLFGSFANVKIERAANWAVFGTREE
ncbi:tRNA (N6-isopentenyl adenosine(37)-C2)-methylthiotransferase MiaB [Oscillospiraceae bacterium NSJ-54]|uniref:tRNA-2-methylthio-N(6)-dimethylallyladenosine synthase n=2 Tax=Zongyangia hominis TaxID=2763677 RepID=A0A926EC47_9FIRM|nr:tRNA (N6-isopentenyl adenosine(37)-C2)-methylthiotransferase MiaB [Zongyangia hominis]